MTTIASIAFAFQLICAPNEKCFWTWPEKGGGALIIWKYRDESEAHRKWRECDTEKRTTLYAISIICDPEPDDFKDKP